MSHSQLEELFSLEDKVIVLTGAGGLIVGEMALRIARCKAKVVVLDISPEASQARTELIKQEGFCAIALQADVLDKASLEEACGIVMEKFGTIDGLVNGAGGNQKKATTSEEVSFFDLPTDAINKVFDLNCMGTMLACQVFGREMVKQKSGSIVNIASVAGSRPLTRAPAYAAAKAAVINFTQWLSVDIARNHSDKIRVNAIAPGFCATEQNRYLLFHTDGSLTPRGQTVHNAVPQNRFGQPEELVGAAIWLLSNAASFVTGSVVTVDGGFDAFSGV